MKLLLVTHNPICTYSNIGKTLASLFEVFESKDLCQLYTYPCLPDIKKCNSYYRLTDIDVLHGLFKRKKGNLIDGSAINQSNTEFDTDKSKKTYKFGVKKNSFKVFLRDVIWRFFGWKSRALYEWIKSENPTHIFVLPGRFKFISRIALTIARDFNLPIVTYICDDFYFIKKPKLLFGMLEFSLYKKQMRKLINKTAFLVTVSQELSSCFQKEFDVKTLTAMTGTNYEIASSPRLFETIDSINYLGNISCGRYKSLYDIGKTLDKLNSDFGIDIKLNIYSSENIFEAQKLFDTIDCIEMKEFISGKEFENVFFDSQALIHVESFDLNDIDRVKHSVSTKIADSLASGIALLPYGPDCVSSILHLTRNNYPIVITNQNALYDSLKNFIFNPALREACSRTGLKIATNYHNSKAISESFHDFIDR